MSFSLKICLFQRNSFMCFGNMNFHFKNTATLRCPGHWRSRGGAWYQNARASFLGIPGNPWAQYIRTGPEGAQSVSDSWRFCLLWHRSTGHFSQRKKQKYTKYTKYKSPKITKFAKNTKYELWNLYIIQSESLSF